MTLKTRIDKAEAESLARLKAERKAAVRAFIDWIDSHTPAETAAFWRVSRKVSRDTDESEGHLKLCGGVFDVQPGDEERLAAMLDNIPPELAERLQATHSDSRGRRTKDESKESD